MQNMIIKVLMIMLIMPFIFYCFLHLL